MRNFAGTPALPQEILPAATGKLSASSKTQDFSGTPAPPQEIALDILNELKPLNRMRNFLGTPGGVFVSLV